MNAMEQAHQQDLERLKLLRYMDDDFMTVCLADNFEGVELILRIVLGRKDIKIKSVRTQETMKNHMSLSGKTKYCLTMARIFYMLMGNIGATMKSEC